MGVREVVGEWLDRKGGAAGAMGAVEKEDRLDRAGKAEKEGKAGKAEKMEKAEKVVWLPVAEIVPNPAQPRKLFHPEELESLARSIAREGLLQPVLVRRTDAGYELIAGERRLQAVKSLGKSHIPAILREGSDTQSALWALIENLQRKDLTFFEEASAIEALIQVWGINQEEAAARLGRSQPAVANKLRLLKLSPAAREAVVREGLCERQARALLQLPEDRQAAAACYLAEHKLNVSQSEEYIQSLLPREGGQDRRERQTKKRGKSLFLVRDVRLFVNTLSHAVEIMHQSGIQAQTLSSETEEYLEYLVRIPKAAACREKEKKTG